MGYEFRNVQLQSVNGTAIENLRQLVKLLEAPTTPFLRFQFKGARTVVLNSSKAKQRTPEILARHKIAQAHSLNPALALVHAQNPTLT